MDEASRNRRKHLKRAAIGLSVVMLYVFSVGPMYRLMVPDGEPNKLFDAIYAPLIFFESQSQIFASAVDWWLGFWV